MKWDSNNVPDQKGKISIVTGSSSGIGYETARVLANKNAKVIIAVRNLIKGNKAAEKIKSQNSNADIEVMEINLANLNSVKKFVEDCKNKYSKLDLLINNAGVMIPPYSKTADGFELQFGTNHLGHFALTAQLFELIKNTPGSRIVNVSSGAHKYGNINFNDLAWEKRNYKAWKAYGDSKIANLYFTYELAKKLEEKNINSITAAAHPGWTATDLQRHSGIFEFMNKFFAQKIEMGALPTIYAATAEGVKSSEYYGPSGWQELKGYPKKVESNELSHNKKIAAKLWEVSEELTGLKFNV
jgi:NAD(P)-dependent dehydrogenase (short-subunit alcohol dehydrogenase family)